MSKSARTTRGAQPEHLAGEVDDGHSSATNLTLSFSATSLTFAYMMMMIFLLTQVLLQPFFKSLFSSSIWSGGVQVDAMEWYRDDTVDDDVFVVPNDQSQWSMFPLQQRWSSFDSPHNGEADFSCESLMDEVDICNEESSLYWTTLLNNHDYQPNGLPGTDHNFMNSLLVDDVHASDFYASHAAYSMGNNVTSDTFLGSSSGLCNVSTYEHLNADDFPYSLDWEMKQSCYNRSDALMTNAIITRQACTSRDVGDQPSVEETVLQEFGSAMQKMTDESRICFRDALYRLASNSQKHSSNQRQHVDNLPSKKPCTTALPVQTLRSTESEACESRTNAIDRTVADFMFHKAYLNDNCHQELITTAKLGCDNPLKSSLAPHFKHFTGPTPEDAVVPTFRHGEAQYSEY